MKSIPQDVAEKLTASLLRRITTGSGCWLVEKCINPVTGYAQLSKRIPGGGMKNYLAHRVVYTALRGPIPDGMTIDHLCRVRRCVNPDHLEPVSLRENILRSENAAAKNARKVVCLNGHDFKLDRTTGFRYCPTCRKKYSAASYLRRAARNSA